MISSKPTRPSRAASSRYSSPARQQRDGSKESSLTDAARQAANDSAVKANGNKNFMERWLEPSLQNKTSYEEAGLMKYGVVENMAPLGTMPKPKKPEGGSGGAVRKIILKTSGNSGGGNSGKESPSTATATATATATPTSTPRISIITPSTGSTVGAVNSENAGNAGNAGNTSHISSSAQAPTSTSTPTPTPASTSTTVTAATAATAGVSAGAPSLPPVSPLQAAPEARKPRKSLPVSRPEVPMDDEDDGDFVPNGGKKSKRRHSSKPAPPKKGRPPASVRRSSLVPGAVVPTSSSRLMSPVKVRPVTPQPSSAVAPPTPTKAQEQATDFRSASAAPTPATHHNPEFVAKVIEAAVDEALHHFRYPTAYALRTLYDDNSHDPAFVAMIEDVFTQTADAETMRAFASQMEQKKREGKKDNTGCYYFVPPATNSPPETNKPLPAPYGNLVHQDVAEEEPISEPPPRAIKKIKITHPSSTAEKDRSPRKMVTLTMSTSTAPSKIAVNTDERSDKGEKGERNEKNEKNDRHERHDRNDRHETTRLRVKTPSRRKRGRRDSASSESSLSSAMSLSSPEVTQRQQQLPNSPSTRATRKSRARPSEVTAATATSTFASTSASTTTGTGTETTTGPVYGTSKFRPINTRRKSLASKASESNANTPTIQSPTNSNANNNSHILDDAAMPARVTASEPPVIPSSLKVPGGKRGSNKPIQLPPDDSDFDEVYERRRREATNITNNYTAIESSVRDDPEEQEGTPQPTRRTRQSLGAPPSTRTTRATNKKPSDNANGSYHNGTEAESPAALSFQGDHPPSSVVGSRPVTPTNLRPSKKQKTGLRIKLSPVKKKGASAGLPRSMGDAQSLASNGTVREQSDNDDFCSACGSTGDVVCCEGCPRSFHFECVDMDQSDDLPEEWFCNECLIRRYPARVPVHTGTFASLLNNLENRIPEAFSLPKKVQNRFEGVRANKDGDYEEIVMTTRSQGRKSKGYEEQPDFFKLREDGEAILCHDCQKPANDVRPVIPCSACTSHWHTDCLNPPLANPPQDKSWKCPLHIDDLLSEAPSLAPAHRYRKLKNQQAIVPAIGRGLRNNGHIEIDWSAEDAAREEREEDASGWREWNSFGRTYKIPAKGVVLDFIEQMRSQGAGYGIRRVLPDRTAYLTPPVEDPTAGRTVDEMQASLVLSSLSQRLAEPMDGLVSTLLSSADPTVISLIAEGNASNITRNQLMPNDKTSLRTLLAHMETLSSSIRDILTREDDPEETVTEPDASTDDQTKVDKMDIVTTEPTPPSTIEGGMDCD